MLIACLFSVHSTISLSRHEHKVLKELQADTSTVILPAGKGRSTVILNHEDYLEKWSVSITLKNPTTKVKTKTLKQLKVLKDNEFIDNKLYYLKPTDLPAPRFYGQPKMHKPGVPICPIVSSGSLKMKITTPKTLLRFPTTSEMFPLKMMR